MNMSSKQNEGKPLIPEKNDHMLRFVSKKMKKFSPDQRDNLQTRLKLLDQFKEDGYELQFHSPYDNNLSGYKKKKRKDRFETRMSSSMSKGPVERIATHTLLSESAYLDWDISKIELGGDRNIHFNS